MIDYNFSKLLTRQINRKYGSVDKLPDELKEFIQIVNETYKNFDDDIQLLENSIEISSQELRDAYQKQKQDAETERNTLQKIQEAISAINDSNHAVFQEYDPNPNDSNSLLNSLIKLIAEHKHTTEVLHQREYFIKSIAENSPSIIYLFNVARGHNIYTNRSISQCLGYSANELTDEDPEFFKKLVHPDDLHQFDSFINSIDTWPEDLVFDFEYRILSKDGTWRWFKGKEKEFQRENSKVISLIGTVEDVTEKRMAEEAVRESEARFRNVLQDVQSVSVQGYAVDGTTQYWNKASERFYGYTSDEAIGRNLLELIIPPDIRGAVKQSIQQMAQTGQPTPSSELSLMRKDGSMIPVFSSHTIIQVPGQNQELFCIDIDLTERKKAELELILSKEKAEESDRLKSAFLANMSHEIRTPMNGILGFAELLKEPGLTGEEQQRFISVIEKSGARMLNIINEIIDISKIESGQMEITVSDTDVNKQMDNMYAFFKPEIEGKGIRFTIENKHFSNPVNIVTDREKLYSILTNLLKNAVKYTESGSISFGYTLKSKNDPNGNTGPTELEFFVKDTGIGVPKDRQDAIFERFVQADIADKQAYQGAGLGLAITKAYVEMLGGRIWIESNPTNQSGENGANFYFTLPYNTRLKTASNTVIEPEKSNTIHKKLNILIADDEDSSEILLSMIVKKYAKQIIVAHTGLEAVNTCLNNPDIDLILLDIKMPVMDGYEATRQIRQFNKEVIIIAQTAFALLGDREKAIAAGCNDYISKPIKKDDLLTKINEYF
jgi:PAS domain S-box-containing protein